MSCYGLLVAAVLLACYTVTAVPIHGPDSIDAGARSRLPANILDHELISRRSGHGGKTIPTFDVDSDIDSSYGDMTDEEVTTLANKGGQLLRWISLSADQVTAEMRGRDPRTGSSQSPFMHYSNLAENGWEIKPSETLKHFSWMEICPSKLSWRL